MEPEKISPPTRIESRILLALRTMLAGVLAAALAAGGRDLMTRLH